MDDQVHIYMFYDEQEITHYAYGMDISAVKKNTKRYVQMCKKMFVCLYI